MIDGSVRAPVDRFETGVDVARRALMTEWKCFGPWPCSKKQVTAKQTSDVLPSIGHLVITIRTTEYWAVNKPGCRSAVISTEDFRVPLLISYRLETRDLTCRVNTQRGHVSISLILDES